MIIILDGKEYAVGLSWFAITSTDEVQQFQKEMDLTHGVLKFNKDPALPSTVALAGAEYEGEVSLAGILSYAYNNLIYVAKTDSKDEAGQTLYYLCTVKNGAVSVEGDMIADLETVQASYAANLAELTAEIDLDQIERFGTDVNPDEFEGTTLTDFSTVLEPAQRYASQCKIKTLAKAGLSKTAVGLIVVLFLLGGYLGYSWLFKKPPPPPVVEKPVVAPPPPRPTIIERRDPYEVFLESFAVRLGQAPAPEIIPELINAIKNLSLSYGGWDLRQIVFIANNVDSLDLAFTRQPYSNANELLTYAEMGYFTKIAMTQEGNTATAAYPIVLENIPYIEIDTIRSLPRRSQTEYFNMISTLQSYNIAFDTEDLVWNDYFAEDRFSISGTGLWSLQRLANILSEFDTVGISSLEFTTNNANYNWKIQGIIYG